jgi:hypothetical protein
VRELNSIFTSFVQKMTSCGLLFHCNRIPKKEIKRAKFSEGEDEQILALVERFGNRAWDEIAEAMGNQRTKRQLRERWQNYLSPTLEPAYTEWDDQRLVGLYGMIGPQWARIASAIGNKSAISARNRYRALQSMKAHGVIPDYQAMNSPVVVTEVEPTDEMHSNFADFGLSFGPDALKDPWALDFDFFPL